MDSKVQILQLAKNTSIELLDNKKPIREILQECKNICKLAEILDENLWIELELNGYLVKYKIEEELNQNLPSYRKTNWKFYDLHGNMITFSPQIMALFGKSVIYHSVQDLEEKDYLTVGSQFLDKFNNFISEHGMDNLSKSIRIHEARITKDQIATVLEGIKRRIQEFLDMIISLLE